MKSAVLCVCFALVVHRGGRATTDEEFKPTPIPLAVWPGEKPETLTDTAPPAPGVDPIPARYWEDALRHSVYLTLVRDKIDQLIAKGNANPNHLLEGHARDEDHNLWERIKSAPFDRINVDEPPVLGDVTLVAKGRLLEANNDFQFIDDELLKMRCDEACMQGVKALWSVKRVRQKDMETVSGKYHYELTFTVNSQTPKKIKKPHESSIRTFTVRDGTPVEQPTPPLPFVPRPQRAIWLHKNVLPVRTNYHNRQQPQGLDRFFLNLFGSDDEESHPRRPHQSFPPVSYTGPQPGKTGLTAVPTEQYPQKKPHTHPLYKYTRPPLTTPPVVSQAEHHYKDTDKIKIPFAPLPAKQYNFDTDMKVKVPVSTPQIEAQQQVQSDNINTVYPLGQVPTESEVSAKIPDEPLTPVQSEHSFTSPIPFYEEVQRYLDEVKAKYPLTPPAVQYHYDMKNKVKLPKELYQYIEPVRVKGKPTYSVKTTRPPVLPSTSNDLYDFSTEVTRNLTEATTMPLFPEIHTASQHTMVTTYKPYKKNSPHKPLSIKLNYTGERLRPPVFNAPPGVFMTLEKKPFKPMPPLKYATNYHTPSKILKSRPLDFRPSPQVVDIQLFSDPDPLSDTFRPMPALNFTDKINFEVTTKNTVVGIQKDNKNHHELNSTKTDDFESDKQTTDAPEIITAETVPLDIKESMDWAQSLLSALADHSLEPENNQTQLTTTSEPTTTTIESTTSRKLPSTTETKKEENGTTTPSSKKRTRPPPNFEKTEKVKKHKRITSTTTSTTSTTETPYHKSPSANLADLVLQATSAVSGTTKSAWQPKPTQIITTTTLPAVVQWEDVFTPRPTVITSLTTTPIPTTTTTKQPTTTKQATSTTTTKLTTTTKKTTTTPTPETDTLSPKNKNRFRQSTLFYKGTSLKHDKWSTPMLEKSSTVKSITLQQRRKGSNFQRYTSSSIINKNEEEIHTPEHDDLAFNADSTTLLEVIPVTSPINISVEREDDEIDSTDSTTEPDSEIENSNESSLHDKIESEIDVFYNQGETLEGSGEVDIYGSESQNNTTPATVKKSKCKKKKNQNLTTTEETATFHPIQLAEEVTSEKSTATTANIFAEIFAGYTVEGLPKSENKVDDTLESAGSERKEKMAQLSDDLEDFLDSQESKKLENDSSYEYAEEDSGDYSYNSEKRSNRHTDIAYDEYRERPYSLIELMAMD